MPFEFDGWGIDVAVGGSQKALSASPGISFVAVTDRAWQARRAGPRTRGSTSIGASTERFAALPEPENPWTPAISVMQGLHAALELYFQDGVDAALRRHQRAQPSRQGRRPRARARPVRRGARGQLDRDGDPRARRAISADTICDRIRSDFGCVLAPGQGPLKGKVFRIGHFGYVSELDIIRGLAALEMTLERLGHPVKRGAAVAAAEQVFQEAR